MLKIETNVMNSTVWRCTVSLRSSTTRRLTSLLMIQEKAGWMSPSAFRTGFSYLPETKNSQAARTHQVHKNPINLIHLSQKQRFLQNFLTPLVYRSPVN